MLVVWVIAGVEYDDSGEADLLLVWVSWEDREQELVSCGAERVAVVEVFWEGEPVFYEEAG